MHIKHSLHIRTVLRRGFRFCLRLSSRRRCPRNLSLPPARTSQPAAAGVLSPGYGEVPGGSLFIQNIKRTIVRNKRKSVQLSTFPPVFRECEVSLCQVKGGGLGARGTVWICADYGVRPKIHCRRSLRSEGFPELLSERPGS